MTVTLLRTFHNAKSLKILKSTLKDYDILMVENSSNEWRNATKNYLQDI